MRYAILGDIHSNLEALEAVLADIAKARVDALYCVGDIVGYAADPGKCIARLKEINCPTVAGNHDYGVVEKTSVEYFNPDARDAVLWTRKNLSDEDKKYLVDLPLVLDCEHFTLAHGTLHSPDSFDYILTIYDAHLSFQTLQRSICFLGHSHVPITFFNDNPISYMIEPEINLDGTDKVLVNVGSVGQPRDQDKRAAWALYDVEKRRVWIRRVEYDVEAAARKILEAGLPQMNAERLSLGR